MTISPELALAPRPVAMFAMRPGLSEQLFDPGQRSELDGLLDLVGRDDTSTLEHVRLHEVETLITGWGCPRIGAAELDRMPSLRAIHHAAGTVKEHLDTEVWNRGILVTTAAAANAVPVAEYTISAILLAGKDAPRLASLYRRDPALAYANAGQSMGNYRRRVGILGASTVGRRVIELLQGFDIEVSVSDPYLAADDPVRAMATVVELDELFECNEIVSIHAPLLPETVGLVSRRLMRLLPDGATLINTARGPIVDHDALVAEAASGRIRAVLDVTDPEPLPAGHPLLALPSVTVTPHIAGALGNELRRLGSAAVAEVRRRAAGLAPCHPVRFEALAGMA